MLERDPKLASTRDDKLKQIALHVLAQKPQEYIYSWICGKAFMPTSAYQLLEKIWKEVLNLDDKEILDLLRGTPRVLFEAVKSGNVEFVSLLVKSFPYLIREVDEEGKRLVDVAVSHRNKKIFKLIYNLGAFRDTTHIDDRGNNMLHLAGKLSKLEKHDLSSRPSLQLQREFSWFKAVEKIMSPAFINMKNKEGETPKHVFLKEHKELMLTARNAMKETATPCMVVSTLISGIVFAAVNDSSNGNASAVFSNSTASAVSGYGTASTGSSYSTASTGSSNSIVVFMIFAVSNVVALFSSTTSTIMLLAILTSLFVESDYIKTLRANMRWALNALFISIISLVVAFTAAVYSICECKSRWVPNFTAFFAPVPIILFIFIYFKLGMGRI